MTTRLPILMFHALDTRGDVLAYAPDAFARVCAILHDAGWRALAPEDLARQVRNRTPFPPKHFVLTFDDGYASVYRVAFPLLQKYGWRAVLFVAPGEHASAREDECLPVLFGREMLRWREIREMHANGMSIGAHTLTHCDLTRVGPSQAECEIIESGKSIARALNAPCSLFAYPHGRYDMSIRAIVAAQYDAAFSTRLGLANAESDCFALERVEMYYLHADWAARGLVKKWLPYYLAVRNVPRRVQQWFGQYTKRDVIA